MPAILLAKGARGELVRKVQLGLTGQGFDPHGADGKYGKDTEAAVKAFQQANGLEPDDGKVRVSTWTKITGSPVPTTQERSLQVTAAFEGHGFTLAQGNWDGAGITWGIIGFTLKHGELSKIILTIHNQDPALVQQAFGDNTEELISVMTSPKAMQMQFANAISLGMTKTSIKEPWLSGFKAFGEIAEVQMLQLQLADQDYGQPALETATGLGLRSELGRALAFDIHVQNGGIKSSARQEIEAALEGTPTTTEQQLRVIIANAVADKSKSFQEDVRARKLAIATGTGKVHGDTYVLSNWGLDETLADS
jgi:peptidoglycan hydrolase-like protein with peptidoglycan-binding domain